MRLFLRDCRSRIGLVFLLLANLAGLSTAEAQQGKADRPAAPNLVFILCDDLGQGDLGCYNPQSKAPTPNMDRLAAEGMRFTDAHTPSSVCTPTRYGVVTGRYCWRSRLKSGVLAGYSPMLIEPGRETVASMLKKQGYRTGVVGKWHLGLGTEKKTDYRQPLKPSPNDFGFDYSYIIPASLDMAPYLWVENGTAVEQPTESDPGSKRVWDGGNGFWRGGPIAPSFKHNQVLPTITKKSVAFIDKQAEDKRPFFLYVPYASPHTPWVPNDPFRGKSQAGAYGDFVHETDAGIGEILAALDRNKLTNNTLVVITSDNGSHWPTNMIEKYHHHANNHRRGMKADIHEGGHRVPFLVRWPGKIKPNTVSEQTICLTDWMATAAAVAGCELPKDAAEDSYSLLPILLGEATSPLREATVHHSANGTFAIRQGDWKLVEGNLGSGGFTAPKVVKPEPNGPQGQLYNLAEDPQEKQNVYLDHPEVVARLTTLLKQYRDSGHSRPLAEK